MKAKKIAIVLGVILLLGAIVGFTVNQSQKNVVTVQSGKVIKQVVSTAKNLTVKDRVEHRRAGKP